MAVSVKFNTPFVQKAIRDKVQQVLRQERAYLLRQARKKLSIRGTPQVRSKPGEYPRLQTGELWDSMDVILNKTKMTLTIVARAPHAFWLQNKPESKGGRHFMTKFRKDLLPLFTKRIQGKIQKILNSKVSR